MPVFLKIMFFLSLCLFCAAALFGVAGILQDSNRPLADLIGFSTIGITSFVFLAGSAYIIAKG